ncbi:MAG: HD domain-containing protein [Flavobacteriales bacterium]|nr:HD domain-containing protein [Flavobacteriales bacterium]
MHSSFAQERVRFDHLTIKEGLSQSYITCFAQDPKGYMWIGTQDGLNRYDGYSFEHFKYDSEDTNSLSGNYIFDIIVSDSNTLWIATDNGISKLNLKTLKFSRFSQSQLNLISQQSNYFRSLFIDSNQDIWIGPEKGGLSVWNHESNTFKNFRISKNTIIRDICEDFLGNIWVATEGSGLFKLNKSHNGHSNILNHPDQPNGISSNYIRSLYTDNSGLIWIATDNGINLHSPNLDEENAFYYIKEAYNENGTLENLENLVVNDIIKDQEGYYWIACENKGFLRLRLRILGPGKFEVFIMNRYNEKSIGEEKTISDVGLAVYEDYSGVIWLGTTKGISKNDYYNQTFIRYKELEGKKSLNDNIIWSIEEAQEGKLWIGTRKGLNILDLKSDVMESYPNVSKTQYYKKNSSVLCSKSVDKRSVYLGTVDGLVCAKLNSKGAIVNFVNERYGNSFSQNFQENRIYDIIEGKKGEFWIGTRYGIGFIDKNNDVSDFFTFDLVNEISERNLVRCLHYSSEGEIWIGTKQGLKRMERSINGAISFESFRLVEEGGYSNDHVSSITEDEDGNLWLGTFGSGLLNFDPETGDFVRYTEKDGLSNNFIYGLIIDKLGKLWVSTNRGITAMNPKTKAFKIYREEDGLQSDEFNMGAYARLQNGALAFGGINGFNLFNPSYIKKNSFQPKVVITDFSLVNKNIVIRDKEKAIDYTHLIELKYKQNNISISYAALHYASPEKNEYKYRLKGFDENWISARSNRTAYFTNLPHGEYIFEVIASNGADIWSTEPARISITIKPAFWQTFWFRAICTIVFAGLVFLVFQARIQLVKRQKEVLSTLIEKRTREVINQKEQLEEQKKLLEEEKEKADKLLRNMLPQQTVEELQLKGKARARSYRMATVMFTDFKNFTKISESMRPKALVNELDAHFKSYDEIIEKYHVEKIKTIGDSYMCVGGIPIRNRTNPIDVVLAAMEIQRYMKKLKEEKIKRNENFWEIRIGIHTGELIAGVIGTKRFAYDIWGDTVNVANRMEMSCVEGKVNISGKTYSRIKNYFDCTYRGKIKAKNKGEIDMYYVEGIKEEYSMNADKATPNQMFWEMINLSLYSPINYRRAEENVLQRLKARLPQNLFYHSVEHTVDVCSAAERIALSEGVKGEDLFLVKTAALYHDVGYIRKYHDNEVIAVEMAKESLPKYGYTDEQINKISNLILATRVPQKPMNHLEEILCDADLDYLGRDDFDEISENLKKEFIHRGQIEEEREWDEIQISFITRHKYFTPTSRALRGAKKKENLAKIKRRYKANNYKS